MNHKIYSILTIQFKILCQVEHNNINRDEYINMYIRISLQTKMLELLIPLYKLLLVKNEEQLLLREYYKHNNRNNNNNTVSSMEMYDSRGSSSLIIIFESIGDNSYGNANNIPWYVRIYRWIISHLHIFTV